MDIQELNKCYEANEQRIYGEVNPDAHEEFMINMHRIKENKKRRSNLENIINNNLQ